MNKLLLIIFLILFISGCTQLNDFNHMEEEKIITVNEYFNESIPTFTQRLISSEFECLNGSCPDSLIDNNSYIQNCFFCDDENNGIKGERFNVFLGSTGGSQDSYSGCVETWIHNEVFNNFSIIEKTENNLKIRIIKTGTITQDGINCELKYKYNYKNVYEWEFKNQ